MNDEFYMDQAIEQARIAFDYNEVPVGAVLVINDEIITKGHNLRQESKNPTGHAEYNVIQDACSILNQRILSDATLYVTLEPCLMCAGLILQTRIKRVVYGASQPKFGVFESLGNVFEDYNFNHKPIITKGIKSDEISKMMKEFFRNLRKTKL